MKLGRREQKKQQTAERIALAARDLFHQKGYDATTTQEITLAAGIAPATLFGYVSTKEDVLVLAFVHEALKQVELVRQALPPGLGLLDAATFVFAGMMDYHAREPDLHKRFLREVAFNTKQTETTQRLGQALRAVVADLVATSQAAGQLRDDVSPQEIAWLLFAHYWNATRHFYHGADSIADFAQGLRRAMSLQVEGLAPAAAQAAPARPARWRTARDRRARASRRTTPA